MTVGTEVIEPKTEVGRSRKAVPARVGSGSFCGSSHFIPILLGLVSQHSGNLSQPDQCTYSWSAHLCED